MIEENILKKLLFLDTETTGLEKEDKIFQVAYSFRGKEYSELFLPPVPISIEASEITGYINKDVYGKKPFSESFMKKELKKILEEEENIFIAHNAKFDVEMIERENLKVGKIIDTLKVAQALDIESKLRAYRLQYLRYALNLEIEGDAQAHDALGDVRVLKSLFLRLFNKIKKEDGISDEKILEKMIKISSEPILIRKFTFGKYNGEFVKTVVKNDRGYLEWLLKEKQKQAVDGDFDEDWIYTLEKHL